MNKIIVFSFLFVLVLITITADLYKRSIDGIPDKSKTGITTTRLKGSIKTGIASVDITSLLIEDKSSVQLSVEPERYVNPILSISLEEEKKKSAAPKYLNKFYLKCLVLKGKNADCAIFTVDMTALKQAHLNALYNQLSNNLGIDSRNVQVFTPGLSCNLTLSPKDLAEKAEQCLKDALANSVSAEYTYVQAADPSIPSNQSRVTIPGMGAIDVAPLCGPSNGKTYDATLAANKWISTLMPDTAYLPPLSLFTHDEPAIPISMLLFRSSPDHIIGGIVIAPFIPIIAPKEAVKDYSTDYTFHVCSFLEKKLQGTYLFIRSPGADLIPVIDNFSYLNAQRFGIKIGNALFSSLKKAEWSDIGKALSYYKEIHPPLKDWVRKNTAELINLFDGYDKQLKAVRNINLDIAIKRDLQDKTLNAYYLYKHLSDYGIPVAFAIKGLRINSLVLLSLPGDYLLKTERSIRSSLDNTDLIIADNLGAYISTIVPKEDFNGGYLPNSSIFSYDAESNIVDEVHKTAIAVSPAKKF